MTEQMTLVTGGTGKTGRRVAERLWGRGVRVRIGSRAADLPFDWNDRATWPRVLDDVDAAYIAYHPDLALPGTADLIRDFAAAAVAAGVGRLVLLSGRGETEAQRCERVIQDCGTAWTIVRSSWFSQNFSEAYLLEPLLDGEVALPAGRVPEPFVDADDVADVAVAALTDDRHAGRIYEVTGPRLWTFADATAAIATAAGRDVRFVDVSIEEYAAALESAGVPADVRWLITYLFTEVLDGRNASVHDGVQRALRRPPRDFSAYVQETATTGVWAGPALARGTCTPGAR